MFSAGLSVELALIIINYYYLKIIIAIVQACILSGLLLSLSSAVDRKSISIDIHNFLHSSSQSFSSTTGIMGHPAWFFTG